MGFLICQQCGGYYELQQGEYPEDFENCSCGGKLYYKNRVGFNTGKWIFIAFIISLFQVMAFYFTYKDGFYSILIISVLVLQVILSSIVAYIPDRMDIYKISAAIIIIIPLSLIGSLIEVFLFQNITLINFQEAIVENTILLFLPALFGGILGTLKN